MFQKNLIEDLPCEIRFHVLSYLDLQSFTFWGRSNKKNFHEILSLLPKILSEHSLPMSLITSIRGSSFFYFNNTCYACGTNEPSHSHSFENIQKPQINLPGKVLQVATGFDHTLILTTQGLYGFGANTSGQLGLSHTTACRENFSEILNKPDNIAEISLGGFHTLIRTTDGKLYACGANEMGQLGLEKEKYTVLVPVPLPADSSIIQVAAGNQHTVVLTENKKVYICGGRTTENNKWVELENIIGEVIKIFAGTSHSVIWTTQGIYCHWENLGLELVFSDSQNVKQIAVSGWRILILDNNGCMYNYDILSRKMSEFLSLEGVEQIGIGNHYTLAITKEGIYGCGENNFGQLGLGDYEERETWTLVESLQPVFEKVSKIKNCIDKLNRLNESFQNTENKTLEIEKQLDCTSNYM